MNTFDLLMNGFGNALTPGNLLFAAIGVLLGTIAIILIIEMKSLLIGEGAAPATLGALRCGPRRVGDAVRSVC